MDFTKSWKTLTLAMWLTGLAFLGEYFQIFDPSAGVFAESLKWCMLGYAGTSAARKIATMKSK